MSSYTPPPGSGLSLAGLSPPERSFLLSFLSSGGTLSPSISLSHIPHQGRAYVANEDIPEGTDLFVIPRHLLLNTGNSALPGRCRAYEAEKGLGQREEGDMSLDEVQVQEGGEGEEGAPAKPNKWDDLQGWSPLILCMMWEQWRSSSSPPSSSDPARTADTDLTTLGASLRSAPRPHGTQDWSAYLDIMPRDFSHLPMFWSEKDLAALRGTGVPERVGRDEADGEYWGVVRPFIRERARVFLGQEAGELGGEEKVEELIERYYSLEEFHVQGSRILSRSFHVKKEGQKEVREGEAVAVDGDTSMGGEDDEGDDDEDSDDEDGEEQEDTSDISMVPMADMLNASYASENARLFYHSAHALSMRATRPIKRGEQILNTYGDPPNADLLRRYGYVDLWNGADEAEISAGVLVDAVLDVQDGQDGDKGKRETRREALLARIAHCVSLGLEESYVLTYAFPPRETAPHRPEYSDSDDPSDAPPAADLKAAISQLDEELLVAARALTLTRDEGVFQAEYVARERLPKARLDEEVSEVLLRAIEVRLGMYEGGGSSAQDEERVYSEGPSRLPEGNERNAVVVRLGEKRVLESNRLALRAFGELKKREEEEKRRKEKEKEREKNKAEKRKGAGEKAENKAGKRARK